MRRSVLILILGLCLVSAVLGWLRADPSSAQKNAFADGWEAMQYQALPDSAYKTMASQVKASSLLPLSLIAERRSESDPAVETPASKAGKFPKILSAPALNRVRHVILEGADKSLIKVKVGDTLESGWTIKAIEKTEVIATFETEEIRVPVAAYLQTAFEKPDEGAMDGLDANNNTPKQPTQNR